MGWLEWAALDPGLGCEGLGWALLLAAHPVNCKSRGQILIRSTSFGKVKVTKGCKIYTVNLTSSSLLDCFWDQSWAMGSFLFICGWLAGWLAAGWVLLRCTTSECLKIYN